MKLTDHALTDRRAIDTYAKDFGVTVHFTVKGVWVDGIDS